MSMSKRREDRSTNKNPSLTDDDSMDECTTRKMSVDSIFATVSVHKKESSDFEQRVDELIEVAFPVSPLVLSIVFLPIDKISFDLNIDSLIATQWHHMEMIDEKKPPAAVMYISAFSNETQTNDDSLDSVLKQTLCSFVRSQVLFVAVRLDLFTKIEQSTERSFSIEDFSQWNISISMIKYLVYLRLIEQCPNSSNYQCTTVTRRYLISTSPTYVGLGLGVWDYRQQYKFFLRFDEFLRNGHRIRKDDQGDQSDMWTTFEHHQDSMIYFAQIMSSFTRCTIDELCHHVDLSSYSTLFDVGGSLGELSRTVLQHNSHLNAFSMDLPALTRYAQSLNKNPKINYITGDFFNDQWPEEIHQNSHRIDLVTLKYILHDWNSSQREYLVKKIYNLLNEKVRCHRGQGTLIVIEKMIDSNRENLITLSTSISMAIELGDGIGYDATEEEYRTLLTNAGFQRIETKKLTGPMVVLLAHVI